MRDRLRRWLLVLAPQAAVTAASATVPAGVAVAAAAPAPSPAPATPASPPAAGGCRKLPAGKRIVKLTLKPDTDVTDLVAWISSVTCEPFIVPGTIPAGSRKVTILSPQLLTRDEAFRLFLDALDSVGLTVYRSGGFLRVIETSKAKSAPLPLYVD